ncbi:hypothetical protein [Deinococcus wulumuqiensis]|uniref:Uncharacterized protein n=1 Tax=Deinococcus wulumuqiensis TaxID=980427 RepID=A0A345IIH9_9DEIO|nr:hypothetical protein [Deinococcus wulumuqiensis]AXG99501.1 hypothetical protein DVJ83_10615 [Deinococcus wulumuqiensis]QII21380.1 hypothetical protein G6R31_12065 [Deinococcus wulumuqiensis R12]GGI82975.1 hypothetical protein GCM10010914_16550 [Deinococcus wulumuqiensis]GGP29522.1 hypothetical protein GCM10008021_11730 [Deinococcus wulumuqiensis]
MQILSKLMVILGLLVTVGSLVYLGMNVIEINQLHAVAYANKSNEGPNPVNNVMLMTALAVLGGFLSGLGLSMPKR